MEDYQFKDMTRNERRKNNVKKGRHYKEVLRIGKCAHDEKSDLYYKDGHPWGNEEREYMLKVTNSKHNGYNPSMQDRKSDENQLEQLREYEKENS